MLGDFPYAIGKGLEVLVLPVMNVVPIPFSMSEGEQSRHL